MVDPETRVIRLVHDGELADVRGLLDDLGVEVVESSPGSTPPSDPGPVAAIVATPQYLAARLRGAESGESTPCIAILDGGARTLRSLLARGGVQWLVRRPFHPAALRLLLLHCLYRGPDKRRARRVGIGAGVRIRVGWRKRGALLVELSPRDCRLLSPRRVDVGRNLSLQLPATLLGRRALWVRGRVVRTAPAPGGEGWEVSVRFDGLEPETVEVVEGLVAAHERGPASLGPAPARPRRRRPAEAVDEAPIQRSAIVLGGRSRAPWDLMAASATGEAGYRLPSGAERRTELRHPFPRRVIALFDEATRVLVGRDLSLQGMRVDPSSELVVGDRLRLAIHVAGHETPLVVDVSVDRDDGDAGLLLRFVDPSPTAAAYLRDLMGELPSLSAKGECGDAEGLLVSEILESPA